MLLDGTALHDARETLVESCGELAIKYEQHIPQEHLDHLADERFDSVHTRAGNFHRVGSVPMALVEKWLREGYDARTAPVSETLRRLKLEGYDKFLSSQKRI